MIQVYSHDEPYEFSSVICEQKETEIIDGICEGEEWLRGGDRGMVGGWAAWDIKGCMDSWTVLAASFINLHKSSLYAYTLFMT